jgi:hypothetical protein
MEGEEWGGERRHCNMKRENADMLVSAVSMGRKI